jgi:Kef-type K+ transport system membrane component KefB
MDVPFAPLEHGDVLQLVIQIAVLLGAARLLGELARRFGQPAVVGEILAGVILGPSVVGALLPDLAAVWVPASPAQSRLLETVALFGAMLLLVVTGLETDLALIRRRAGTAVGVALGGLLLPLAGGFALGWWFPVDLVGDVEQRLVFSLFLATAMAVSAIPVLAAILIDLRIMRRDIGQTMLAAGMVDDLAGWTLLGFVIALAEGDGSLSTVFVTIATVAAFLAVTVLVGPPMVRSSLRFVHGLSGTPHRFLTLTFVLVFGWSAVSQALHLEPVIGAFAMGILLGRARRLPRSVSVSLEQLTLGIFAPLFFAIAGLKVDLGGLAEPRLAGLTVLVIVVAVVGKVAGAYVGGRWLTGADRSTSLSYGIGLTARGAIGIVVATIGRSLGILGPEVFSMIVAMAVVTSLMTPPLLKLTLGRVIPSDAESVRLRREHARADSSVDSIQRVLVPLRPRPAIGDGSVVKTKVLMRLAEAGNLAVTVMSATEGSARGAAEETVRHSGHLLAGRADVSTRVVSGDPVASVLAEAQKGYDLLMLGATEIVGDLDSLFGSAVDAMIRLSPVPTMVVSAREVGPDWEPRRILIPTDGTAAARSAADLAFELAGADGGVAVLHVVAPDLSPAVSVTDTGHVQRFDLAHQIVSEIRDRGEGLGVDASTMIEMSPDVESAILEAADRFEADLIVLGTSARTGTRRLYLGPRVERLLIGSTCPVIVLNS